MQGIKQQRDGSMIIRIERIKGKKVNSHSSKLQSTYEVSVPILALRELFSGLSSEISRGISPSIFADP
jgi:hypothetical protein